MQNCVVYCFYFIRKYLNFNIVNKLEVKFFKYYLAKIIFGIPKKAFFKINFTKILEKWSLSENAFLFIMD